MEKHSVCPFSLSGESTKDCILDRCAIWDPANKVCSLNWQSFDMLLYKHIID